MFSKSRPSPTYSTKFSTGTIYRAKCKDCKHEWTSRKGSGTPDYCPKCRSKKIVISPIG